MLVFFHETESGYVWWDEALLFLVPIVLAVALVWWAARRGRSQDDD